MSALRIGLLRSVAFLIVFGGWALAACGGGPTPAAPATPAGEVRQLLTSGQAALEAGNLAGAEKYYRDAVAADPKSADAQFGLGNVLVRQNRLSEAEAAYKAALALDPNHSAAHANLGVVYYQQGNMTAAAQSFQAALRIKPNDAPTVYLLAAVRIQEGNLAEAEKLLNQAKGLDPNLPEVYYGLGVLYKLKGQKDQAIAAFEKFLEIGPGQDPTAVDYAKAELKELKGE